MRAVPTAPLSLFYYYFFKENLLKWRLVKVKKIVPGTRNLGFFRRRRRQHYVD